MLPITTTNNSCLDLLKLWGNILATTATSFPTYFLEDVQIFADNITNTSSVDSALIRPEKLNHTSKSPRFLYELNDEVEIFAHGSGESDVDSDGNSSVGLDCTDRSEGKDGKYLLVGIGAAQKDSNRKKCQIQRMRYGREEYHCPSCPYRCTTEHAFVRHLRTTCAETPPPLQQLRNDPQQRDGHDGTTTGHVSVSCCVCGRDRSGERTLALHMRRHRTGKHFHCDLCHFQTLQLKKLIQHRRMHTGEKPHLCPHCPYRSARRDNLRSHVRRVHKKDNLMGDTFTPTCLVVTPTASSRLSNCSSTVHTDEM